MIEQLKNAIHHYAKRQMTWFSAHGGSPPKADTPREYASGGQRDKMIHWVKNYHQAYQLIKSF
jgi:tRNA A37 N6-isopentenylltransferase MiaA